MSASTQRQALNALVFLYRAVLDKPLATANPLAPGILVMPGDDTGNKPSLFY
ncbi:MAG: phage integrase N-terminal SAM-like domain-containing protein [bacterium]